MKAPLSAFLFAIVTTACGGNQNEPAAPTHSPSPTGTTNGDAPEGGEHPKPSIDETALDLNLSPCNDFYQYACGQWKASHPLPDDEAAYYRTFSGIRDRNEVLLRNLLENFSKGENTAEPYATELGALYQACTDEPAIEQKGLADIEPFLKRADALKSKQDIASLLADLTAAGVSVPFAFSSSQDLKDTTRVVAQIDQGGLGLPDREYYLSDNAKHKEIRDKYQGHMVRMFELGGSKGSSKKLAADAYAVEVELARASMSKEELREPEKLYHPHTKATLSTLAPDLEWEPYLSAIKASDSKAYNVAQPDFLKAAAKLSSPKNLDRYKSYLRWHILQNFAMHLPKRFVDEAFSMRQALTGAARLPDRWKRCVRATNEAIGEALGQAFVHATLGDEGKAIVKELILNIERAMNVRLTQIPWMDDATRAAALTKLGAISNKVAYPDRWRNYAGLRIDRANHTANMMAANRFEFARQIAKIGKPVDRTEWLMTPPTVNAYYEPLLNEMVFPAGILQPPFFDKASSTNANYGAIGMVMGHELTHAFDDEGRKFDAQGNLREWWSATVNKEFETRADCVKSQYEAFEPLPGLHINGKLTMGENIADLGGLKLAHAALATRLRDAHPTIAKGERRTYTNEQEFFLSFAQGWCSNEREAYLRLQVATNPHSPAKFRVNGPVANLASFARAFGCKEGDAMRRGEKQQCEVW